MPYTLEKLYLSNNNIDLEQAKAFVFPPELQFLDLHYNSIDIEDAVQLALPPGLHTFYLAVEADTPMDFN